eukprot:GHVS01059671.1.p1 GENE.GHVS01059671.1~~GHVS01059671.1.p1  ORF type:complete len:381 (-),score=41.15 GHVS01059671.1:292-1434(-)
MAKFQTGTRNLLAATPTLLLLAFSSLSFIPLSLQAPADDIETTFKKTQLALQGSGRVRTLLSNQREIYWPFVHNSREAGLLDKTVVAKMFPYRLNDCLKLIQQRHCIADHTDEGPIVVRDIDFGKEVDDEVKVTLVSGSEDVMFYININPRRMNKEQQQDMKDNLIPTATIRKALLREPDVFWGSVLDVRSCIGDEAVLLRENDELGGRNFAEKFDVAYTGKGNIKIYRKDGLYHIERYVVAAVWGGEGYGQLLRVTRNYMWPLPRITEVPDLQKRFWKAVTAHFADGIAGALKDPSTAIQEQKPFEYPVGGDGTVTTMLTNVERKDNDTVVISCVSTFPVLGDPNDVRVLHEHSMMLPKWTDRGSKERLKQLVINAPGK